MCAFYPILNTVKSLPSLCQMFGFTHFLSVALRMRLKQFWCLTRSDRLSYKLLSDGPFKRPLVSLQLAHSYYLIPLHSHLAHWYFALGWHIKKYFSGLGGIYKCKKPCMIWTCTKPWLQLKVSSQQFYRQLVPNPIIFKCFFGCRDCFVVKLQLSIDNVDFFIQTSWSCFSKNVTRFKVRRWEEVIFLFCCLIKNVFVCQLSLREDFLSSNNIKIRFEFVTHTLTAL